MAYWFCWVLAFSADLNIWELFYFESYTLKFSCCKNYVSGFYLAFSKRFLIFVTVLLNLDFWFVFYYSASSKATLFFWLFLRHRSKNLSWAKENYLFLTNYANNLFAYSAWCSPISMKTDLLVSSWMSCSCNSRSNFKNSFSNFSLPSSDYSFSIFLQSLTLEEVPDFSSFESSSWMVKKLFLGELNSEDKWLLKNDNWEE